MSLFRLNQTLEFQLTLRRPAAVPGDLLWLQLIWPAKLLQHLKQKLDNPLLMIIVPKSQRKWFTPQHRMLTKIDALHFHSQLNNQLKFKQITRSELRFLDEVKPGEHAQTVARKLGDPFFIHRNTQSSASSSIFTYVLKSGSYKLKAQLHFNNDIFLMGTIAYNAPINYIELNSYFRTKYQLPAFNILRDTIADKHGNLINFMLKPDLLIILFQNQ